MVRKIVIFIVMLLPAAGAAVPNLSLPELLALGCLPALVVAIMLAQSQPQDTQNKP